MAIGWAEDARKERHECLGPQVLNQAGFSAKSLDTFGGLERPSPS